MWSAIRIEGIKCCHVRTFCYTGPLFSASDSAGISSCYCASNRHQPSATPVVQNIRQMTRPCADIPRWLTL